MYMAGCGVERQAPVSGSPAVNLSFHLQKVAELYAVFDMGLLENIVNVVFYRSDGQVEVLGYVLVGVSVGDHEDYLLFPVGDTVFFHEIVGCCSSQPLRAVWQ